MFSGYFDKTFVLSPPTFTERHDYMRARLRVENVPFEFFDGIDARGYTTDYLMGEFEKLGKRLRDPSKDPRLLDGIGREAARDVIKSTGYWEGCLTPARLAMSLGHQWLYRETVKQGWNRVLVFEDDAGIVRGFHDYMDKIVAELEGDPIHGEWDVLYLASFHPFEVCHGYPFKPRPPVRDQKAKARRYVLKSDGSELKHVFHANNEYIGAWAYAFSQRAAKFFLEYPYIENPDGVTGILSSNEATGWNTFIVWPFLATNSLPSEANAIDASKWGFILDDMLEWRKPS